MLILLLIVLFGGSFFFFANLHPHRTGAITSALFFGLSILLLVLNMGTHLGLTKTTNNNRQTIRPTSTSQGVQLLVYQPLGTTNNELTYITATKSPRSPANGAWPKRPGSPVRLPPLTLSTPP